NVYFIMKFALHVLALCSLSLGLTSCCSLLPCDSTTKAETHASAQANGGPHIGLIPTMKELAASD
ncbi:MAG: hypothetical protein P8P36_01945, partial [Akkermansiaceae bacterium]|nr:hypothetical protein [Akkermansiaceae bacterium]